MLIFLLILAMIIISGLNAKGKNEFYEDYCSPKNTATANAVFSVLIFLRHAVQYIEINNAMDIPYTAIDRFLSQSVVVTYLFYSGYGIMESINKKKHDYVKKCLWTDFSSCGITLQ